MHRSPCSRLLPRARRVTNRVPHGREAYNGLTLPQVMELHSVLSSQSRMVEYRIGRGQSAGIASIMQPTTRPKVGFGSNWVGPRPASRFPQVLRKRTDCKSANYIGRLGRGLNLWAVMAGTNTKFIVPSWHVAAQRFKPPCAHRHRSCARDPNAPPTGSSGRTAAGPRPFRSHQDRLDDQAASLKPASASWLPTLEIAHLASVRPLIDALLAAHAAATSGARVNCRRPAIRNIPARFPIFRNAPPQSLLHSTSD
jgi:hypothetical protein